MKQLFFVAAGLLLLQSCNNDDNGTGAPLGSYDNGVLVLNEGGIGEITYISNDLAWGQQDVFAAVNGQSQDLGMFAQSMFFDGDRAFIISNGSNKITVANRYSMEYIATIATGLNIPRYGVAVGGKAYVTNSASFDNATDDFVTVIDLADLSVETPIMVNTYAEKITAHNGKLYVAGGFYGVGDKITVINTATQTVTGTIATGQAPNSFEAENNILYVLCSSYTAESKFVRIDLTSDTVIDQVSFPSEMINAANLDVDNGSIYFTFGSGIYKVAANTQVVTNAPIIDTQSDSFYIGYGFAVHNGRIYISEGAADFASDGKIFVYSTEGNLLKEISSGLGPNGFYFND
jgi:hypothetical protein